jgi:amino acid transporter
LEGVGIGFLTFFVIHYYTGGRRLKKGFEFINWIKFSVPIIGIVIGVLNGHINNYILNEPQITPTLKKIYTIEVTSIINETEKFITVLWGDKEIRVPKSEIIKRIEVDNKIYFIVTEETYSIYFE